MINRITNQKLNWAEPFLDEERCNFLDHRRVEERRNLGQRNSNAAARLPVIDRRNNYSSEAVNDRWSDHQFVLVSVQQAAEEGSDLFRSVARVFHDFGESIGGGVPHTGHRMYNILKQMRGQIWITFKVHRCPKFLRKFPVLFQRVEFCNPNTPNL